MIGNINNSLWVEKYRPDTLEGYVGNDHIVETVKKYIEAQDVPHLLFSGRAGTGKTTLAKIIVNLVDSDVLYINASDENNVETVRSKIKNFASTAGFKRWKIIILDECDYMTINGQAALRNLMETFSKNTRFILTCNYIEKIIDPIQSRCVTFQIIPPNKSDVAKRLAKICVDEKVEFKLPDIVLIVNKNYPDIRKILNIAQSHVINNKLVINESDIKELDYMNAVLDVLISKKSIKDKFTQIRTIVAESGVKQFEDLFRFLYDHVEEIAPDKIGTIILLIADYQYKSAHVVDQEINISAMFVSILNEL
jgi:replication factor C small subunit